MEKGKADENAFPEKFRPARNRFGGRYRHIFQREIFEAFAGDGRFGLVGLSKRRRQEQEGRNRKTD